MMTYITDNQKTDHLINPPDKKNNPWMEKVFYQNKELQVANSSRSYSYLAFYDI